MAQRYNKNVSYSSDLAKYLQDQDWKRFCTFTTGYELTLPSARRLMKRFYERAKKKRFIMTMYVYSGLPKNFEMKDGYHTHGLFYYPDYHEECFDVMELLKYNFEIVSGTTQCRAAFNRYNKRRAAGFYCAKYLTKQASDYDILC